MNDVFVTNKGDFDHSDRFNGVDYFFPRGEKVCISQAAARHMFGFGVADKSEALVRLGWSQRYDKERSRWVEDDENGAKKLSKFVFTQAQIVEVPAEEAAKAA